MITDNDKIDILNNRLERVNRDIYLLQEALQEYPNQDLPDKTPRSETLSNFIKFKEILIKMINDFTK